jgi:hypothetical protein
MPRPWRGSEPLARQGGCAVAPLPAHKKAAGVSFPAPAAAGRVISGRGLVWGSGLPQKRAVRALPPRDRRHRYGRRYAAGRPKTPMIPTAERDGLCARLDQSRRVARTQRRTVPTGSDGGASDLTASLAGTLNSGQAKGRGIRRALRLEPPAGCHVLGCGTIRM